MGSSVENFIDDAIDVGIKGPETIVKGHRDTLDNILKGEPKEALKVAIKASAPMIVGTSKLAKKRQADAETKAKQDATDKQVAFEEAATQKDLEAKRKAAQERLARRKSTPGRPIFTSTSNERSSLL